MSFWKMAKIAPVIKEIAPMIPIKRWVSGLVMSYTRTPTNTPAATIVAAWIKAEAGVGPSMASGNQDMKGNCADFAIPPVIMAIPMRVGAMPCIAENCHVSKCKPSAIKPNNKAISPKRLIKKAFFAACVAADF